MDDVVAVDADADDFDYRETDSSRSSCAECFLLLLEQNDIREPHSRRTARACADRTQDREF